MHDLCETVEREALDYVLSLHGIAAPRGWTCTIWSVQRHRAGAGAGTPAHSHVMQQNHAEFAALNPFNISGVGACMLADTHAPRRCRRRCAQERMPLASCAVGTAARSLITAAPSVFHAQMAKKNNQGTRRKQHSFDLQREAETRKKQVPGR